MSNQDKIKELENAIEALRQEEAVIPVEESEATGIQYWVGKEVIVRTYFDGVWFGTIIKKLGMEVIIKDARRMQHYKNVKSPALSGVALYGIDDDESCIVHPVNEVGTLAIGFLPLTEVAANSIRNATHATIS